MAVRHRSKFCGRGLCANSVCNVQPRCSCSCRLWYYTSVMPLRFYLYRGAWHKSLGTIFSFTCPSPLHTLTPLSLAPFLSPIFSFSFLLQSPFSVPVFCPQIQLKNLRGIFQMTTFPETNRQLSPCSHRPVAYLTTYKQSR